YRILNHRHIDLVGRVDENAALRRIDQERGQALRADIIKVADNPVRRKLRALLLLGSDVALEQLSDCPDVLGFLRKQNLRGAETRRKQQNKKFCSHNGDKSISLKLNLQFPRAVVVSA